MKISQYPLPEALIGQMVADGAEEIIVMEEGQPVVEEMMRGLVPSTVAVKGRLTGELPRMGELTPDSVRKALGMEPRGRRSDRAASARPVRGLRSSRHVHGAEPGGG